MAIISKRKVHTSIHHPDSIVMMQRGQHLKKKNRVLLSKYSWTQLYITRKCVVVDQLNSSVVKHCHIQYVLISVMFPPGMFPRLARAVASAVGILWYFDSFLKIAFECEPCSYSICHKQENTHTHPQRRLNCHTHFSTFLHFQ